MDMEKRAKEVRRGDILIVDDHEIVRDGVTRIIDTDFDGYNPKTASTYGEAIEAVHLGNLAMVIIDLSILGRGGIDLIQEITSINRDLPVLVYSMHDEKDFGLRAIKSGASGYVNKGRPTSELKEAIRQLLAGKRYVSHDLAQNLVSFVRKDTDRPPHERLSTREFQILCRLTAGAQIKEIASELFLSVKTVSTYRARIFVKLDFKSIADMVRYAVDHGLV
jgi:two-component system invasion response regulator UvrY